MSKVISASSRAPKNISVFLRVRPPVPREKDHTFNCIKVNPKNSTVVHVQRKNSSKDAVKDYTFNHVFDGGSTQKEVYEKMAKSAVDACFDGQHGVLFVYGQTGSGKTFTISNTDSENLGILQQGLKDIWERIGKDADNSYTCTLSYVQLYNELLSDLLDDKKAAVRIQIGAEGYGDVDLVSQETGLRIEKPVKSYEHAMSLFATGMRRKEMSSTSMNQTSSRSHTIFTFSVTKTPVDRVVRVSNLNLETDLQKPAVRLQGRLVLCDLAGSERVSKSHAEGKTLDEATHINSSLLVLGKVVAALSESAAHVPFRESKLTRVLQYSLLGNGNTSIMVNISPSDDNIEESLSAILFGQRAHLIKQDAKRHEVLDYRALYLQLMADIDARNDAALQEALEEEKTIFSERIQALNDHINTLQLENELLKQENATLRSSGAAAAAAAGGGHAARKTGKAGAAVPTPTTKTMTPGSSEGGNESETTLDELIHDMKDTGNWLPVVEYMRSMVLTRDKRIGELAEQRRTLGAKLSDEKTVSFNLVRKLQSLGLRYKSEREAYTRHINELKTEMLVTKSEDVPTTPMLVEAPVSPAAVPEPETAVTEVPRAGSESGSATEPHAPTDLLKALESIRVLRLERTALLSRYVNQNKVIQMLTIENQKLKLSLAGKLKQTS